MRKEAGTMATAASISGTNLGLSFILFLSAIFATVAGEDGRFVRTLDRELVGLKKEKLTHFRLYWHDILTGKNPSAVQILPPLSNATRTGFGLVRMIDNPLTAGPELSSKLLGRAQGLYASAAQEGFSLLMVMNLGFVEGEYNGSSITVMGRNQVSLPVREMPVIGGSGRFRFARGYVEARTRKLDTTTGDATVEYNVYVLHY